MSTLIPVAEADRHLGQLVVPMGKESCPLKDAVGRLLREPVRADRDLPPFDRVMMDGYAIRFSDLGNGTKFTISGSAMAGAPRQSLPESANSAVEVMTGSPLPEGADTVIPIEDTTAEAGSAHFILQSAPDKGQYVHRKGSDYQTGTILVPAGVLIRSIEAGIAASCGYASLVVSKAPIVSIFGTGDELVPVEVTPAPHQIRQSNACAIMTALKSEPVAFGEVGHLSDVVEIESARLRAAAGRSDLVIISGAVSKGRLDWIPQALDSMGIKRFHGVSQRPGKPMGVWTTEHGCVIFALPGNPVSTLVCTHRFLIPFIRARLGLVRGPTLVSLDEPFSFDRPLTLFVPAKRTHAGCVQLRPVNNSGDYAGLAGTDGFVELAAAENHWTTGTKAPFHPWQ